MGNQKEKSDDQPNVSDLPKESETVNENAIEESKNTDPAQTENQESTSVPSLDDMDEVQVQAFNQSPSDTSAPDLEAASTVDGEQNELAVRPDENNPSADEQQTDESDDVISAPIYLSDNDHAELDLERLSPMNDADTGLMTDESESDLEANQEKRDSQSEKNISQDDSVASEEDRDVQSESLQEGTSSPASQPLEEKNQPEVSTEKNTWSGSHQRPQGVGPHPGHALPDEPTLLQNIVNTFKSFQLKTNFAFLLTILFFTFLFTWVNLEWAIMLPLGFVAAYLFLIQRDQTEGLERMLCRYGLYAVLALLLYRDIGITQDVHVYKRSHATAKKLKRELNQMKKKRKK